MLNAETKPNFLCLSYINLKKMFYIKNNFLRKTGSRGLNKKWKQGFLTALPTEIKKYLTASIRKNANEWKVCDKTVRTVIKEDLSLDLNLIDYAILDVLERKTSHPLIGSLKTAIEEE